MRKLKSFLFENGGTRQTIAKNILWLTISEVASRLVRSLIIIYAARVLGAASYGVFSYALGLAAFFTIFADLGLIAILTRGISQNPESRDKYFATAFWIKIIPIMVTVLLVVFAAPHFSKIETAKSLLPLLALLIVFDGIRDFSLAFFRGLERMEFQALITVLTNFAIAGTGFFVLRAAPSVQALTASYVASAGVGTLVSLFVLRHQFAGVFRNFSAKLVRPIVSAAWPFAFTGLLGAFMLNTDIVILGWLKGEVEVGLYSASQRIVQVLYVVPAILSSAIFPVLSRLWAVGDREKTRHLIEKNLAVLFALAIPLAIGGIAVSGDLMRFVYGSGYEESAPIFRVLITMLLVAFPGTLISNIILAYDKQRQTILYIGIASVTNIALNFLLIPVLGAVGAALATLIAQIVNNGLTWSFVKKVNRFAVFRKLQKIILASAIMAFASFALYAFGAHVLLNIAISGSLYTLLLILFKETIAREALAVARRIL